MSIEKLNKNANKLVIGRKEVLDALKTGGVSEVFTSQNCSAGVFAELLAAAKFSDAAVKRLEVGNDEMGAKLKQQFRISVVGIKKQA